MSLWWPGTGGTDVLARFGYVAISLELKNASPNKTTTVRYLSQFPKEDWVPRLAQLARQNLHNQLRILRFNHAHDIQVYRFTSNLVPLATHEAVADWAYEQELADAFREVGDYVRETNQCVSFHPDHFVNLHSPNETVRTSSVHILKHHDIQTRAMGLGDEVKFNIHIGGTYGDKGASLERFIQAWGALPNRLQRRITLENDDKTYNAVETLAVCQKLGIPMVFDVHHHRCNPGEGSLETMEQWLPQIIATWKHESIPPKIHVSSPRGEENGAEFRSHADFVNPNDVVPFLRTLAQYTDEVDVMIEAKAKDKALFQLMRDIEHMPGVSVVNGAAARISR